MAYPKGLKEVVFTTTGGNPYFNLNATTGLVRLPTGACDVMVRAIAFVQTSTNVAAAVISVRLASAGGSTSTGTVIDTITTTTGGAGRGKIFWVDNLRTIVSAGSDVYAVPSTAASKVRGKLVAYVDSEPFDLLNNTRATESA